MNPTVSVVMPVYNVERHVAHAIKSVLQQTFTDFELIVVDDGGSDASMAICRSFDDPRICIISQANRGLAGARNTGIAAVRGEFVALLDSDDAMKFEKLERHVTHLRARSSLGISYAGADLIDDDNRPLGVRQQPKLGSISLIDVFCGQVILNGSVSVFRRAALEDASLPAPDQSGRRWYFDETSRRSEDVECWVRIAMLTSWGFGRLPGCYTDHRVNRISLSSDVPGKFESWDQACQRIAAYAPSLIARYGKIARARAVRYLACRSFYMRDRGLAVDLAMQAVRLHPWLLLQGPRKTLVTLAACVALRLLPDVKLSRLLGVASPTLA